MRGVVVCYVMFFLLCFWVMYASNTNVVGAMNSLYNAIKKGCNSNESFFSYVFFVFK